MKEKALTFWQTQLDRLVFSGGQFKLKIKNSETSTKWLSITSEQYLAIEHLLLEIEETE